MKHVHDTWYLLVDGTHADPNDVNTDEKGVLRNKSGTPVAMRDGGIPHTVGHDAKDNKNVEAAQAGQEADRAAEKQKADNEAAAKADATEGAAVQTEIDPATGEKTDPVEQPKPAGHDRGADRNRELVGDKAKKPAKNRELKAADAKKYQTR